MSLDDWDSPTAFEDLENGVPEINRPPIVRGDDGGLILTCYDCDTIKTVKYGYKLRLNLYDESGEVYIKFFSIAKMNKSGAKTAKNSDFAKLCRLALGMEKDKALSNSLTLARKLKGCEFFCTYKKDQWPNGDPYLKVVTLESIEPVIKNGLWTKTGEKIGGARGAYKKLKPNADEKKPRNNGGKVEQISSNFRESKQPESIVVNRARKEFQLEIRTKQLEEQKLEAVDASLLDNTNCKNYAPYQVNNNLGGYDFKPAPDETHEQYLDRVVSITL